MGRLDRQEGEKALQDFFSAYFFVWRVRILNARTIHRTRIDSQDLPQRNALLNELMDGYFSSALAEFALMLYDAVQIFKKIEPSYKFQEQSPVDMVLRFRRHMLAHRGMNWMDSESIETRESMKQGVEDFVSICIAAAKEFSNAVRANGIILKAQDFGMHANVIRMPTLKALLEAVPLEPPSTRISSEEEYKEIFG